MAIAERMPEVGRRYYEQVLEKTINRFAAYLDVHVQAGELAIPDSQLAASQFMQMCQASLFLRFIFQASPPPSAERIARSGRKRDADVFGGVSGEGGLTGNTVGGMSRRPGGGRRPPSVRNRHCIEQSAVLS